ncbi:hypothetical protein MHYP_G00329440 [Metynnis hypsauchen]
MIKELKNRGNVVRNLPPKDLPTASVAESCQSPESMAPSESSEEYYQMQPSLTFVQDKEKIREYCRKLSDNGLTKQTVQNDMKSIKRQFLSPPPAPEETRRTPVRGLDPGVAGAGGGGTSHSLLGVRSAANDTQGNDHTLPPQKQGTTSPTLTAQDDSVEELGHDVTITLPADTIFCMLCIQYLGTVLRADIHFKSTHGGVEVRYECGACPKSLQNCHSISCHVPKCRGLEAPSSGGPTPAVRCKVCGRDFSSAVAVSIHERHVHPNVRNEKRIRQERMRGFHQKMD